MKKEVRNEKALKREKIKIKIKKQQLEKINIEVEEDKTYFEVIDSSGILHTYDVAEGVASMMMSEHNIVDSIWNHNITDKDKKEINASRALYWLTGGNNEWVDSKNYRVDWHEASIIFKKKFGGKITRIVRKARTLAEIKDKFEQNFNLTELYEFAIKNDMI